MSTGTEVLQNEQVVHDDATVRKINKLLSSSETRNEGLELLNWFLPTCSDEVFRQFSISWMQNCCKTEAVPKNRDYAIHLLNDLFKISSNYQELKKSVSFFITTRYFDYFFKYLLHSEAGWNCTESCLYYYRGACGPFQVMLEKHLKSKIEKNVKISVVIGRCFALMPCIGGSGSEAASYKTNWRVQFVNFLNASHFILNDLFGNVKEFQNSNKLYSQLTFWVFKKNLRAQKDQSWHSFQSILIHAKTKVPMYTADCCHMFTTVEYEISGGTCNDNKKEKSVEELTTQLENHLIVLGCMLLNHYPAPKNVPSDPVFQLICRGLALNAKALASQKTVGVVSIMKVLPEIQCIFLSLLKAVIVTCKNQLLPYSRLICKLIKQILEYTENDFTYGSSKSFGCLRILAYEALCNWLAVARSGSCVESVSGVLVSSALNDISSKKKVVFLKEAKLQNRLKGKEQITRRIDGAVIGLSRAAMKTLQFLLKFAGVLLKPEEHKYLQEVLVKLIKEAQKNSTPDVPVPFGVPACRIELYSLLLELICHPCPQWPPPTNYAMRLLKEGMNDPSSKVSSVCSTALNFATIIIHPQYDNGGFCWSEASNGRSETEMELQWAHEGELRKAKDGKEVEMSSNKSVEVENEFFESVKKDKSEKLNDLNEESDISSDEDSRNTVKFLQDSVDSFKEDRNMKETTADKFSANDEPYTKKQKISTEEFGSDTTSLPDKEKMNESDSIKGLPDRDKEKNVAENTHSEEFFSLKNVSPESTNEEGQPKARYYLRSKTKGSSEEPEEAAKRTSSPEASKNTPTKILVKYSPNGQSAKKRPRTRALSKVETNSDVEVKTVEKTSREEDDGEEEDIKAAFFDSFID